MKERPFKLLSGALLGLLCAYLLVFLGARFWLKRTYPNVDLDVIPTRLPGIYQPSTSIHNWPTRQFGVLGFTVPPYWTKLHESNASVVWGEAEAKLLLFHPGRFDVKRYKRCLYSSRWNLLGMLDRGLLLPHFDSNRPRIFEQRVGDWSVFFYPSTYQWWCDLLDVENGHYVALIFFSQKGISDEQVDLLKDIIMSVSIKRLTGSPQQSFNVREMTNEVRSIFSNL